MLVCQKCGISYSINQFGQYSAHIVRDAMKDREGHHFTFEGKCSIG